MAVGCCNTNTAIDGVYKRPLIFNNEVKRSEQKTQWVEESRQVRGMEGIPSYLQILLGIWLLSDRGASTLPGRTLQSRSLPQPQSPSPKGTRLPSRFEIQASFWNGYKRELSFFSSHSVCTQISTLFCFFSRLWAGCEK